MNEATQDAIARLTTNLTSETDRDVTFVIGSGLSNGLVPSVAEMTSRFCSHLGDVQGDVERQLASLAPGEAYQQAARRIIQRRGFRYLTSIIRSATLEAAPDFLGGDDSQTEPASHHWKLSEGHKALANLLSIIPPQRRRAVLTTNFDPLIEVALARKGIPTVNINVGHEAKFDLTQMSGAIPIIHLHGYWASGATLNSLKDLSAPRPDFEHSLTTAMRNSVVWVMAYSGWTDSYMRALQGLARGTSFSVLDTELAWITHGIQSCVTTSPIMSEIAGTPGIVEYVDVDATTVMQEAAKQVQRSTEDEALKAAPTGWSLVPYSHAVTKQDVSALVDGAAPSWAAATAAPLLTSALRLRDRALREAAIPGIRTLAAIGPTGEGKTVGLMQAALALKETSLDDSLILVRNPGAPPMDREWAQSALNGNRRVVLVIDEADLQIEQLSDIFDAELLRANGNETILLLLGLHRHFMHLPRIQRAAKRINLVEMSFDGVHPEDTMELAEFWRTYELLPDNYLTAEPETVAGIVLRAAEAPEMRERSLFGSILHLWEGPELLDRVSDIVERLDRMQVNSQRFSVLLMAIAWIEAKSEEVGQRIGLDLEELARVVGLQTEDVLGVVIRPLGREAGITVQKNRIYTRHPMIARALIDEFTGTEILDEAITAVGSAAGKALRGGLTMAHAPALFSPRLFATGEAKRWALAMVTASGPLLRARVSLLAVHRRAGGAAYADRYATEVDRHLETYSDWQTNARGFWCEWAFSLIDLQRPQEAIEKALLALADHRGIPIYQDGIGYALSAGLSASVRLREQGVRAGGSAHEALTFLESRLSQPKSVVSGGTNHHIARLREAGRLLLGDRIGRLTYRELVRLLDQH